MGFLDYLGFLDFFRGWGTDSKFVSEIYLEHLFLGGNLHFNLSDNFTIFSGLRRSVITRPGYNSNQKYVNQSNSCSGNKKHLIIMFQSLLHSF